MDAVRALLDQLGVLTDAMRDSIVALDSSAVSLKETMDVAVTRAALSPSCRPLVPPWFQC